MVPVHFTDPHDREAFARATRRYVDRRHFCRSLSHARSRLIVTRTTSIRLCAAAAEFTGYASSIIACDAEVGVECWLDDDATPDNRPDGLMAFGFSAESVGQAVLNRTGQSLMTCPTTAVYDGLPDAAERVPLGKSLRFFGDGFQKSKLIADRRYWRIPVMDGEFLVSESLGVEKGIGGGNIILQSADLTKRSPRRGGAWRRYRRFTARLRRFPAAWPAAEAKSVRDTKSSKRQRAIRFARRCVAASNQSCIPMPISLMKLSSTASMKRRSAVR